MIKITLRCIVIIDLIKNCHSGQEEILEKGHVLSISPRVKWDNNCDHKCYLKEFWICKRKVCADHFFAK